MRPPLLAEFIHPPEHIECGGAGARGVVVLLVRGAPESHNCIALELVERAPVVEDDLGHLVGVAVQEGGEFKGAEAFGERGEAANVTEHNAQHLLLPAQLQALRGLHQFPDQARGHVLLEGRT